MYTLDRRSFLKLCGLAAVGRNSAAATAPAVLECGAKGRVPVLAYGHE